MPNDGYRVYMTKAYHTASSLTRAQEQYPNKELKQVVTLAKGHAEGKSQASGVNFTSRQDNKIDNRGCIGNIRLEAIILNRFLLIARDVRRDNLAQKILSASTLREATRHIVTEYNDEIELFPAIANISNTIRENRQRKGKPKQETSFVVTSTTKASGA